MTDWVAELRVLVERRNRAQTRGFADLVSSHNFLVRQNTELQEQNGELRKLQPRPGQGASAADGPHARRRSTIPGTHCESNLCASLHCITGFSILARPSCSRISFSRETDSAVTSRMRPSRFEAQPL